MVWLPDGEKKLQDIFISFDMIVTDRQTDGRTSSDHRPASCDTSLVVSGGVC